MTSDDGRNNTEFPQKMLTVREVARLLSIHINTVRHWADIGQLPSYRFGSRGDRRFDPADIATFLRKAKRRM